MSLPITAGSRRLETELPPEGGELGPITIEDDYTVVSLRVRNNLFFPAEERSFDNLYRYRNAEVWSHILGELYDEDRNFIFGLAMNSGKKKMKTASAADS